MIHLHSEEREAASQSAPDESVRRDARISEHQIHIDDIVETLHEDDEDGETDRGTGDDLRDPADVGV